MDLAFAPTLALSPWADPKVIVAIVSAMGAIIVAAVGREWHLAKKAPTVSADEHEQAQAVENAASDRVVTSAVTIVEQWESMAGSMRIHYETELDKVRARLDAESLRSDRLELEVGELKQESREQARTIYSLRTTLTRIESWWSDRIVARWDEVRQHPTPPDFPVIGLD